ncbi:group II intron maturase-specific domain-containing protein [Enterococcus faecium]
MRQFTKRNKSISLDERIVKLKQVIYGWVNYFRKAKMKRKLAEIDAKLR